MSLYMPGSVWARGLRSIILVFGLYSALVLSPRTSRVTCASDAFLRIAVVLSPEPGDPRIGMSPSRFPMYFVGTWRAGLVVFALSRHTERMADAFTHSTTTEPAVHDPGGGGNLHISLPVTLVGTGTRRFVAPLSVTPVSYSS